MPGALIIDTLMQRENWSTFETGAQAALAMVRSFGADQPIATAMLIKLLVADSRGDDARSH
jgi:hypothetical protein